MKIKRLLVAALAGIATAMGCLASPLTPSEALGRIMTTRSAGTHSPASPQYKGEWKDASGRPAIYIFSYNGDEGFMLLSADDAVKPLLGYSPTGTFAADNLPPAASYWLDGYAGEIEAARALPPYRETATRASDRPAIAPLLKTTWDQTFPYNIDCPVLNGRQCVTGCVATAMAQVMKYWEYPSVGKGSLSYMPPNFDQNLEIDFSAIKFAWDEMQNSYKSGATSASRHAVGTLMKACGYSVKMSYSPTESGAYSREIANALATYFGYDAGVSLKQRSAFTDDNWTSLVYSELNNVGPVIYSGQSTSGAHCFVCDGYDGHGMFHINWGWGGMSDGYFELGELTPGSVGTGGHYGGYNMNQAIVSGVMPPVGRITLDDMGIDNAADDSGNVKGWGYTYRIKNPGDIQLWVRLRIIGGHVSAPLYVTVYETDPETKKNGAAVVNTTFSKPLNAGEGVTTCTTNFAMPGFDPSKFYTLTVAYELKGKMETVGSLRMAASSGVDDIISDSAAASLSFDGTALKGTGADMTLRVYDINGNLAACAAGDNPELRTGHLPAGLYIATATTAQGAVKTLKLLLK